MSQIALTNHERQTGLLRLGYTERESEFLTMAALQGGYFLRRQYAQFLGIEDGGTVSQLIEKGIENGHVDVATYRAGTHLYHLSARPFYAALGQEDNRNRRRKELLTIKTKLIGLDFVLEHLDREFLATEGEKRQFFEGLLGVPSCDLPAKQYALNSQVTERYFVEKYPLFLSPSGEEVKPPVATFCFVDPGQATLLGFETFLNRYARLFGHLQTFEVVYVAASDRLFEKARLLFESRSKHSGNDREAGFPANCQAIHEYFEARNLYEARRPRAFDREKLIRLRDLRKTFLNAQTEALYERWKASGDAVFTRNVTSNGAARQRHSGGFSTFLSNHSYDLFGRLTAY